MPWRLPWNELVDGRLRRFKRGVHYSGPAEALEQEARNAASELDKTAVTFRDDMQVFEYVWVQFVDGKLVAGEPCPRCSNTSFEKLQTYFLRCTRCRAFFALTEPKPAVPDPEPPPPIADFVDLRFFSDDGTESDTIPAPDDFSVKLTCSFHRPLWAVHVAFNFVCDGKKLLQVGSPTVTRVLEPETVTFSLSVPGGLLSAGEYAVDSVVRAILEEGNDSTRLLKDKPSRELQVSEPESPVSRQVASDGLEFRWEMPKAASNKPMPIIDEWFERRAKSQFVLEEQDASRSVP